MSRTCSVRQPHRLDHQLWDGFFSSLETAKTDQNATKAHANIARHNLTLDTPATYNATAGVASVAAHSSNKSTMIPDVRSNNADEASVIVVSSDSENENEMLWSTYAKYKDYKRLWEKARFLVFHRLISQHPRTQAAQVLREGISIENQIFPYSKLQELSDDLVKFHLDYALSDSEMKFLWNNVIQWLMAVKISSDSSDLNYDEKFNMIMIDFMKQYTNYKVKLYSKLVTNDEVEEKATQLMQTLSIVFSGNITHILMTLLRIELKLEYRNILDPIFRKYLTDRSLCYTSNDLIVYLRLIFCFKRWKIITPLKAEREKINEIAVGKPQRTTTTTTTSTAAATATANGSAIVDDKVDSILPKAVPKVNIQNQSFVSISDLIGFAIERKAVGTRILLVYTSLDLGEAITKYFNLYERYINRKPVSDFITTNSNNSDHFNANHNFQSSIQCSQPKNMWSTQTTTTATPVQHELSIRQRQSQAAVTADGEQLRTINKHLQPTCDINNSYVNVKKQLNSFNFKSDTKRKKQNNSNTNNTSSSNSISSNNNDLCIIDLDTTDHDDDDEDDEDNNYDRIQNKLQTTISKTNHDKNSKREQINQKSTANSTNKVRTKHNIVNKDIESDRYENVSPLRVDEKASNTPEHNGKSTNVDVVHLSSDDESVLPVNAAASSAINNKKQNYATKQPASTKSNEMRAQRILPLPTFCRALKDSVPTKPTRKEKHCVPGEVSSTTSLDNTEEQHTQNAANNNTANNLTSPAPIRTTESLEVHSAGTPCHNAREVGTLKVVDLPSRLGFSDVSDDGDSDESLSNTSFSAKSVNWKVVEEATSSTEIFQRARRSQSFENVIFSTSLTMQQPKATETSAMNAAKPADKLAQMNEEQPVCSKYVANTASTDQANNNNDLNNVQPILEQQLNSGASKSISEQCENEDINENENVAIQETSADQNDDQTQETEEIKAKDNTKNIDNVNPQIEFTQIQYNNEQQAMCEKSASDKLILRENNELDMNKGISKPEKFNCTEMNTAEKHIELDNQISKKAEETTAVCQENENDGENKSEDKSNEHSEIDKLLFDIDDHLRGTDGRHENEQEEETVESVSEKEKTSTNDKQTNIIESDEELNQQRTSEKNELSLNLEPKEIDNENLLNEEVETSMKTNSGEEKQQDISEENESTLILATKSKDNENKEETTDFERGEEQQDLREENKQTLVLESKINEDLLNEEQETNIKSYCEEEEQNLISKIPLEKKLESAIEDSINISKQVESYESEKIEDTQAPESNLESGREESRTNDELTNTIESHDHQDDTIQEAEIQINIESTKEDDENVSIIERNEEAKQNSKAQNKSNLKIERKRRNNEIKNIINDIEEPKQKSDISEKLEYKNLTEEIELPMENITETSKKSEVGTNVSDDHRHIRNAEEAIITMKSRKAENINSEAIKVTDEFEINLETSRQDSEGFETSKESSNEKHENIGNEGTNTLNLEFTEQTRISDKQKNFENRQHQNLKKKLKSKQKLKLKLAMKKNSNTVHENKTNIANIEETYRDLHLCIAKLQLDSSRKSDDENEATDEEQKITENNFQTLEILKSIKSKTSYEQKTEEIVTADMSTSSEKEMPVVNIDNNAKNNTEVKITTEIRIKPHDSISNAQIDRAELQIMEKIPNVDTNISKNNFTEHKDPINSNETSNLDETGNQTEHNEKLIECEPETITRNNVMVSTLELPKNDQIIFSTDKILKKNVDNLNENINEEIVDNKNLQQIENNNETSATVALSAFDNNMELKQQPEKGITDVVSPSVHEETNNEEDKNKNDLEIEETLETNKDQILTSENVYTDNKEESTDNLNAGNEITISNSDEIGDSTNDLVTSKILYDGHHKKPDLSNRKENQTMTEEVLGKENIENESGKTSPDVTKIDKLETCENAEETKNTPTVDQQNVDDFNEVNKNYKELKAEPILASKINVETTETSKNKQEEDKNSPNTVMDVEEISHTQKETEIQKPEHTSNEQEKVFNSKEKHTKKAMEKDNAIKSKELDLDNQILGSSEENIKHMEKLPKNNIDKVNKIDLAKQESDSTGKEPMSCEKLVESKSTKKSDSLNVEIINTNRKESISCTGKKTKDKEQPKNKNNQIKKLDTILDKSTENITHTLEKLQSHVKKSSKITEDIQVLQAEKKSNTEPIIEKIVKVQRKQKHILKNTEQIQLEKETFLNIDEQTEDGCVKIKSDDNISNDTSMELYENSKGGISDEDVEKRTPWKMRIKRRISQCSDINKEFNLDSDDERKQNFLADLGVRSNKITIKICKTNPISKYKDISLEIEKESPLPLASAFQSPSKEQSNFEVSSPIVKNRRKCYEIVRQPVDNQFTNQTVDIQQQMPLNRMPPEELLAVTALLNMQQKYSGTNEIISAEHFDRLENDMPDKKESKELKSILKGAHRADERSNVKKKLRFDESQFPPASQKIQTKFTNRSKEVQVGEGSVKGGNKYIKKRLADINKAFFTSDNDEKNTDDSSDNDNEIIPDQSTTNTKKVFNNLQIIPPPQVPDECAKRRSPRRHSETDMLPQTIFHTISNDKSKNSTNQPVYPVLLTSLTKNDKTPTTNYSIDSEIKQSEMEHDKSFASIIIPDEMSGKPTDLPQRKHKSMKKHVKSISSVGTKVRIKFERLSLEDSEEEEPLTIKPNENDNEFKESVNKDNKLLKRAIVKLNRMNSSDIIAAKLKNANVSKAKLEVENTITSETSKVTQKQLNKTEAESHNELRNSSSKQKLGKTKLKINIDISDNSKNENQKKEAIVADGKIEKCIKEKITNKPDKQMKFATHLDTIIKKEPVDLNAITPEPISCAPMISLHSITENSCSRRSRSRTRNEFILRPSEVIITEDIINTQAKEQISLLTSKLTTKDKSENDNTIEKSAGKLKRKRSVQVKQNTEVSTTKRSQTLIETEIDYETDKAKEKAIKEVISQPIVDNRKSKEVIPQRVMKNKTLTEKIPQPVGKNKTSKEVTLEPVVESKTSMDKPSHLIVQSKTSKEKSLQPVSENKTLKTENQQLVNKNKKSTKEISQSVIQNKISTEETPQTIPENKVSKEVTPEPTDKKKTKEKTPESVVDSRTTTEKSSILVLENKKSTEELPAKKTSKEDMLQRVVENKAPKEKSPQKVLKSKKSTKEVSQSVVENRISIEKLPQPIIENKSSKDVITEPALKKKTKDENPESLVENRKSMEKTSKLDVENKKSTEEISQSVENKKSVEELPENESSKEVISQPIVDNKTTTREKSPRKISKNKRSIKEISQKVIETETLKEEISESETEHKKSKEETPEPVIEHKLSKETEKTSSVEKVIENIPDEEAKLDDSDNNESDDTQCVIEKLKLLSPESITLQSSPYDSNKFDESHVNSNNENLEDSSKSPPDNESNENVDSKTTVDDVDQQTAKLLDSAIEQVLGNVATLQSNTNTSASDSKSDAASKTDQNEQQTGTTKRRLDILTAAEINNSIERILEQRAKPTEIETAKSDSKMILSSTSTENATTFKFSLPTEDKLTKKGLSKASLNDVKKIPINVPDALFDDDDSDGSNSGEAATTEEFFTKILSFDDEITTNDVTQPISFENTTEQSKEQHKEEVERDHQKGTIFKPTKDENAETENTTKTTDTATRDLPVNLEVADAGSDFNMFTEPYADVLDILLGYQQPIELEQNYDQDNFKPTNDTADKQTEENSINTKEIEPLTTNNNDLGINQSSFLDVLGPLDEVGCNMSIDYLLGAGGDDLFAFTELDKSQTRSNSMSSDSDSSLNTSDSNRNKASDMILQHTKSVACDHSYNKNIKYLNKSKEKTSPTSSPPITPNKLSTSGNKDSLLSITANRSTSNKELSLNQFTKLKLHPTPYWKTKRKSPPVTSTPEKQKQNSPENSTLKTPQSEGKKPINQNNKFNDKLILNMNISEIELDTIIPISNNNSLPMLTTEDEISSNFQLQTIEVSTENTESQIPDMNADTPEKISTTEIVDKPAPEIEHVANTGTIIENAENIEAPKSKSNAKTQPEISKSVEQSQIGAESKTAETVEIDENAIQSDTETAMSPATPTSLSGVSVASPAIVPQPIIRIQSQTNRLQRIDPVSMKSNSSNNTIEYISETSNSQQVSYDSLITRGSTPTLDERSKDDEDFHNFIIEEVVEEEVSPQTNKRSSETVLDMPIVKKTCLEETPAEKLNTTDLFDKIKHEESLPKPVSPNSVENVEATQTEEIGTPTSNIENVSPTLTTQQKLITPKLRIVQVPSAGVVTFNVDWKPASPANTAVAATINTPPESKSHISPPVDSLINVSKYKISTVQPPISNILKDAKSEFNGMVQGAPVSIMVSQRYHNGPARTPIKKPRAHCALTTVKINNELPKATSTIKTPEISIPTIAPESVVSNISNRSTPVSLTTSTSNRYQPYGKPNANPTDANQNKYVFQRKPTTNYQIKISQVEEKAQIPTSKKEQQPSQKARASDNTPTPAPVDISKIVLSPSDEAAIAAQLEAYRVTLPPSNTYKEHRENKRLLEIHEEKLKLEYFEQAKRRQTQKMLVEAQRQKRKALPEMPLESTRHKIYSLSSLDAMPSTSRHAVPPHSAQRQVNHRQKYINKFSEIEKRIEKSKIQTAITKPLTTPIAWEPKSISADEIIEHFSKMRKN